MKTKGYNNTVAVIGVNSKAGTMIAKSICKQYRLLLMDNDQLQTATLFHEIQEINQQLHTAEILTCSKEASWEADVIIITVPLAEQEYVAQKIAEVSTCKTVLQIKNGEGQNAPIQLLLPHSKVVSVSIVAATAIIDGQDKAAIQLASHLMALTGLHVVVQSAADEA